MLKKLSNNIRNNKVSESSTEIRAASDVNKAEETVNKSESENPCFAGHSMPPLKETWSQVAARTRHKQPTTIIGTNSKHNQNSSKVLGVPKTVSIHVCRISPVTAVNHVINYLKPKFPEVKCEQLESRQPEVNSSFRIEIFENNFKSAMDPEIWPENARVRRFFYPRRKQLEGGG